MVAKSLKMGPTVSIIIPHYNRSILLKDTLESVINQSYVHWEIIIVDDISDKAEWEKIKTYEGDRIKIFQRAGGLKGPSICRNLGSKKASGKYLIFLDSDDLLASFCLEQRVEEMQKDSAIDMAVFLIENFMKLPGDTKLIFNRKSDFKNLPSLFLENNNPWQTMAPIWKKEFFDTLGGFDENLIFMEDPDLHLRALIFENSKIKICYDRPQDCFYRINNIDDTKQSFWYNSIFYRIQFYEKVSQDNIFASLKSNNRVAIKRGIYTTIKFFLYNRKNDFPDLYLLLINLMRESDLFSYLEIKRIEGLLTIGNTNSIIARTLKLRGICFKLLPQ